MHLEELKSRVIVTRYDKLEQNYASMVALAFTIIWHPVHTEQLLSTKDQHALVSSYFLISKRAPQITFSKFTSTTYPLSKYRFLIAVFIF